MKQQKVYVRIGDRFGRLEIIERADNDTYGHWRWWCYCDCGGVVQVLTSSLASGRTQSCGCLHDENSSRTGGANFKHGQSSHSGRNASRLYATWQSMLGRCENPNYRDFGYWGGRGITVCEAWHQFEQFAADMGPRPAGMTLDRINPNGHYEPANCRWATATVQALNKRNSLRIVDLEGTQIALRDAAEYLAMPTSTLNYLLARAGVMR